MKSILLLMLVMAMGITANASTVDATSEMSSTMSSSCSSQQMQDIQVSLSHDSGKIRMGRTHSFQVCLSCPAPYDVKFEILIYIDGDYITSKTVKIGQGFDASPSTSFKDLLDYDLKPYKLVVQPKM